MLYDIKYINLNNNEKFTYTVDAKIYRQLMKNLMNIVQLKTKKYLA